MTLSPLLTNMQRSGIAPRAISALIGSVLLLAGLAGCSSGQVGKASDGGLTVTVRKVGERPALDVGPGYDLVVGEAVCILNVTMRNDSNSDLELYSAYLSSNHDAATWTTGSFEPQEGDAPSFYEARGDDNVIEAGETIKWIDSVLCSTKAEDNVVLKIDRYTSLDTETYVSVPIKL